MRNGWRTTLHRSQPHRGTLFIERARALAELKRDPDSRWARQQALRLLETIRQPGHHEAGLALTPFLAA